VKGRLGEDWFQLILDLLIKRNGIFNNHAKQNLMRNTLTIESCSISYHEAVVENISMISRLYIVDQNSCNQAIV